MRSGLHRLVLLILASTSIATSCEDEEPCGADADCEDDNPCTDDVCASDGCAHPPVPDGPLTPDPRPLDCRSTVCNAGAVTLAIDLADVSPDAIPGDCMRPACVGEDPQPGMAPDDGSSCRFTHDTEGACQGGFCTVVAPEACVARCAACGELDTTFACRSCPQDCVQRCAYEALLPCGAAKLAVEACIVETGDCTAQACSDAVASKRDCDATCAIETPRQCDSVRTCEGHTYMTECGDAPFGEYEPVCSCTLDGVEIATCEQPDFSCERDNCCQFW